MQNLNFLFNNTQLRIYGTVENPYFKVKDICELIQICETSRMIRDIQDENPTGNLPSGLQIKEKNGKYIQFVNEFGLYEILFRTNPKLSSDFKLEIKQLLKQQRLNQKILQQEKISELEKEKEELNQKIIDQQIQHQQQLDNIETIYSVITIHKVYFDPEDDEEDFDIISCPQIICVTKNPCQIFIDYTTKLNNHYKKELNYYYVVLQKNLKKDEALQFKYYYLNDVFGCNKQQHKCKQQVTPLNEYNIFLQFFFLTKTHFCKRMCILVTHFYFYFLLLIQFQK